jgi:hypothetical protein
MMAGLHAQNVQLTPATNITGPLTAVAQGAKSIGIAVAVPFYLGAKKAGAPVGFSLLSSANYTVTLYMGVLKGAPDPLAAQLYESWLFHAAGRQGAGRRGHVLRPARLAEPGRSPLLQLDQLPQADPAHPGRGGRQRRDPGREEVLGQLTLVWLKGLKPIGWLLSIARTQVAHDSPPAGDPTLRLPCASPRRKLPPRDHRARTARPAAARETAAHPNLAIRNHSGLFALRSNTRR